MKNNDIKAAYDFLIRLKANNNKEWFDSNRKEYEKIRTGFTGFVERLIAGISEFDSDIKESHLSVKDCIYRINRDIRFSKDKSPYKTHLGIFICKGGKKSQYSGYYLHIEPEPAPSEAPINEFGFTSGSIICAGSYCPDPKIIKSIRDEISVNGDSFIKALAKAEGYELDYGNALKKVPRGFENIKPEWSNMLRLKNFTLYKTIDTKTLFSPGFYDYTIKEFKKTKDFIAVINKAVQYAEEEM